MEGFSGDDRHEVLLAPSDPPRGLPLLVALHGRGEALKGFRAGAFGWPNDYALTRALERLCEPPLTQGDFEGLVTPEHLAELSATLLGRAPDARKLLVVCPYVPDLDLRRDGEVLAYGRYLAEVVVPWVRRTVPGVSDHVGIDGVSLGGAVALRAGLRLTETFSAVGTLQPAIDASEVDGLRDLALAARARRPTLALRLTTSEADVFRDVTRALSSGWRGAGIPHDFSELPGPHDYVFNRGPGAYEMLVWTLRTLYA